MTLAQGSFKVEISGVKKITQRRRSKISNLCWIFSYSVRCPTVIKYDRPHTLVTLVESALG